MDTFISPARIIKRGSTYQLYYHNPDGYRRRLSAGPNVQQAQRIALKFTDWLLEGKDPEREMERARQTEKAKQVTLKDFFPEFMERHGKSQSKGMVSRYYTFFENICRCPALTEVPMSGISKRRMIDYMKARKELDGVSSATVNREASFVRGVLSRAVEWETLDFNPLHGLRLFKEPEKRDVNLSPDDAVRLIEALPAPVAEIVEFAIYTGFRRENILSLRIESVLLDRSEKSGEVILIVKGGRKEIFPLGAQAVEILQRATGDRKSGYVFINPETGTRYKDIHLTFDRAVKKLGLKAGDTKLRFHDLRHVFATWLHQAGASLDELRPLLGHRKRATTDRYVTIDRKAAGKVLNLMPRIRQKESKEDEFKVFKKAADTI